MLALAGAGAGWCALTAILSFTPTKYTQNIDKKKPLASCDANGLKFLRRLRKDQLGLLAVSNRKLA
jgi:hypothetical protein